jgi:SagB-type dehydrogenase family enzyme
MNQKENNLLRYSLVSQFHEDDHSESEVFHEYSKLNRQNDSTISDRISMIIGDLGLVAMTSRCWKTYRGAARVPLPKPCLGNMTLEEALKRRRSLSSFRGKALRKSPITLEQLSSVLRFSYGVNGRLETRSPELNIFLRYAPSAGGLYPLEVYPLVFDVEGLAPGIYHYRVVDHSLESVREGSFREEFLQATAYHNLCRNAPVVLAVSAVFHRTLTKYLNRGYRFVMNDTGALLQNFYLTGTALRLGVFALGGFFDDEVGELIGINNVDEAVVILFVLGCAD